MSGCVEPVERRAKLCGSRLACARSHFAALLPERDGIPAARQRLGLRQSSATFERGRTTEKRQRTGAVQNLADLRAVYGELRSPMYRTRLRLTAMNRQKSPKHSTRTPKLAGMARCAVPAPRRRGTSVEEVEIVAPFVPPAGRGRGQRSALSPPRFAPSLLRSSG